MMEERRIDDMGFGVREFVLVACVTAQEVVLAESALQACLHAEGVA
eukprot:ctg_7587.g680